MKEQECNFTTAVSEHLKKQPTSQDELSYKADSKTHWCEPVRQEHEKGYTLWASCDPCHEICDGGGIPDKNLKHYWKSTNDDGHKGSLHNLGTITLERQTQEKTITEEQEDPERCPSPQPQALGTTFEARVRDYMAAHSERIERFKNAIFKQCVEINGRMTEMFGLLKELTTNRAPKKDRVGKVKGKTYNVSPRGPIYEAILKKKITKKEDIGGNFAIPCSIGGLKYVNALVDQGSNVNVMPYSTYMKLTDERPAETNIRLSLASHSYIYPLGIAEDVLVEVVEHVYLVDFVILDIKEK
ncbi:reverse transcriptase domain-containing protein [Tanacetum coccineum]